MRQHPEAAMLDVGDQVDETEAPAQQEDEDSDCRRSAASRKALGGQVEHRGKGEAQQAAGQDQR